jgi:nucleoside-diphosphate-sugar epimerase
MPALITGAGLVGSLAAARLVAACGDRPVLYDLAFRMENLCERLDLSRVLLRQGDINDQDRLIEVLRETGADRILHTAGLLSQAVRQRPVDGARANVLGTLTVLDAARLTGVKRVVFCGSMAVTFGVRSSDVRSPLPEDFCLRTESQYPPSMYATMKLTTEWLGQAFGAQHGLEFVSLRLSSVFGPWRGNISGMAGQTMQRLVEGTWRGEAIPVSATAMVHPVNYLYAADAAQAAVRTLVAEHLSHRVYNVAMDRNYTVAELVPLVETALGRKARLDMQEAASDQQRDVAPLLDTRRARTDLGWSLEYPMGRALADYAEWLATFPVDAGPIGHTRGG